MRSVNLCPFIGLAAVNLIAAIRLVEVAVAT
jgi:hypothetical protein